MGDMSHIETVYYVNGTEVDPWTHRCQLGVPGGSQGIHTFQLTWSLICTAQAIFLMTKWPKVGWEAIYMPCCEALSYGLLSAGHGYLKLHGEWHYIPWIRYAAWMVTTPVLLNQVQGVLDVKVGHLRLAPIQSLANLIMIVMGVSAHLQENIAWKWVFFLIGCVMALVIYWVAWLVFSTQIKYYAETKTAVGDRVVFQLKLIAVAFYVGWSAFPLIWMLSSEGLCAIEEHIAAAAHIPADVLSKNIFGLLMWHTRWIVLGGYWDVNKFKETIAQQKLEEAKGEETPQEKRKALMGQAEACFKMADACLQQANDCLKKAAVQEEQEKESNMQITARSKPYNKFTPNEVALAGHPMENLISENMKQLSHPMPFNIAAAANSTKSWGSNGGVEEMMRTSLKKLRRQQKEMYDYEDERRGKDSNGRDLPPGPSYTLRDSSLSPYDEERRREEARLDFDYRDRTPQRSRDGRRDDGRRDEDDRRGTDRDSAKLAVVRDPQEERYSRDRYRDDDRPPTYVSLNGTNGSGNGVHMPAPNGDSDRRSWRDETGDRRPSRESSPRRV
mmetsp:Transcript_58987/g.120823  ORF Transcript_58987/g.120823 Transcript_58987/m.120823 type:complete len:558 (+) Transcript_58987:86-1759(+)